MKDNEDGLTGEEQDWRSLGEGIMSQIEAFRAFELKPLTYELLEAFLAIRNKPLNEEQSKQSE
jgi:hypothetical protein